MICNSPLGQRTAMGWLCQLLANFWLYFRMYRLFRTAILLSSLLFYCEFLHYFVVLIQCTWPQLYTDSVFDPAQRLQDQPLKVMVIADTHILGSRAHWFDKLRREWQMERAFQTSLLIHNPDVVFVLGDLMDEGKWSSNTEFEQTVKRFHKMFSTSSNTHMHVVVGNHDIGFHYAITPQKEERFERAFDSSSARMLRIRNNIFVLVNSMALEGDGCSLCREAVSKLQDISQQLLCAQNGQALSQPQVCHKMETFTYTKPILLQHFPMYRPSDIDCDTPDAAPPEEKNIPFRLKMDCLSKEATSQLLDLIEPRLVIDAHTHHGCYRVHKNDIPEWTLASFNWRNKNNPSFVLATISNDDFALKRCFMPVESTVIFLYIVGGIIIFLSLIFPRRVVKFNTDKAH